MMSRPGGEAGFVVFLLLHTPMLYLVTLQGAATL